MKLKTILLVLLALLTTLACSSAEYASLLKIEYEMEASPSPEAPPTAMEATPPSTPASQIFLVCTGDENGKLRVRSGAGTSNAVEALLGEGETVKVIDEAASILGGTWAKLEQPEGWVNAKYLCGGAQ